MTNKQMQKQEEMQTEKKEKLTKKRNQAINSGFVLFINEMLENKGMTRKTLLEKLDLRQFCEQKQAGKMKYLGLSSVTKKHLIMMTEILEFSWGDFYVYLDANNLSINEKETKRINEVSASLGITF